MIIFENRIFYSIQLINVLYYKKECTLKQLSQYLNISTSYLKNKILPLLISNNLINKNITQKPSIYTLVKTNINLYDIFKAFDSNNTEQDDDMAYIATQINRLYIKFLYSIPVITTFFNQSQLELNNIANTMNLPLLANNTTIDDSNYKLEVENTRMSSSNNISTSDSNNTSIQNNVNKSKKDIKSTEKITIEPAKENTVQSESIDTQKNQTQNQKQPILNDNTQTNTQTNKSKDIKNTDDIIDFFNE